MAPSRTKDAPGTNTTESALMATTRGIEARVAKNNMMENRRARAERNGTYKGQSWVAKDRPYASPGAKRMRE